MRSLISPLLKHTLRHTAALCAPLTALLWSGCFDFTGDAEQPCGGPAACSAPRSCVEGRCVGACVESADCASGERCERQLCVPLPAAPLAPPADMAAVDMGAADMAAADMAAVDMGAADMAAVDMAAVDMAAVDMAAVDMAAADMGAVDMATVDMAVP